MNSNIKKTKTNQSNATANVENLHKCLTKFITGCGLPFSVVENKFFKEFVAALNKEYAVHLPSRKLLSTRLLDNLYDDIVESTKKVAPTDAVILADSWKNTAGKHTNFTVIMHNSDGPPIFVDSYDMTEKPETTDNLEVCVSSYKQLV